MDPGLRRRLVRGANSNQMTACVFGITGDDPEVSLCLRPFGIRSNKNADGGPPAGKNDAGAVGAIAGVLELLDRVRGIFGNLEGAHLKREQSLAGLSRRLVRDHRQLFLAHRRHGLVRRRGRGRFDGGRFARRRRFDGHGRFDGRGWLGPTCLDTRPLR